jgi:hypothetical protein
VFLPGLSDPETLEMASKLSGTTAARERGHEHESRHPVMTEDMIRQLPVRRDGTAYAFILRNGLSPVIGRPPVIWHGRWRKQLTRRAALPSARGPIALPPPPPGRDDLAWRDTIPQPAAALAPASPAQPSRTWQADDPQAVARDGNRRTRPARAWDEIGGRL